MSSSATKQKKNWKQGNLFSFFSTSVSAKKKEKPPTVTKPAANAVAAAAISPKQSQSSSSVTTTTTDTGTATTTTGTTTDTGYHTVESKTMSFLEPNKSADSVTMSVLTLPERTFNRQHTPKVGSDHTMVDMDRSVSYRKGVFDSNYELIMTHIESSDNPRLRSDDPKTRRLSNWMRRQSKRTNVPNDERAKLDKLREYYGDKSRSRKEEDSWNAFFQEMIKYKKEYHTPAISRKDKANRNLYHWVARQRKQAKVNKLLPEHRQKLSDISFELGGRDCGCLPDSKNVSRQGT